MGGQPREGDAPHAAVGLDPVDRQVLALVAEGLTTDLVSRRLGLSERTVRRRLRAVADDLGVATTIEAVVLAVRDGAI